MDQHPVQGGVAILLGLLHATETGISSGRVGLWFVWAFTLPQEITEIENQPWLKNFNLNKNLTCNIYVPPPPTPPHPTSLRGPHSLELSSLFSFHAVFQTESDKNGFQLFIIGDTTLKRIIIFFITTPLSQCLVKYMLWFNFVLGLNFIFFCFWVWQLFVW